MFLTSPSGAVSWDQDQLQSDSIADSETIAPSDSIANSDPVASNYTSTYQNLVIGDHFTPEAGIPVGSNICNNYSLLVSEASITAAGDAILRLYITGESETHADSSFDISIRAKELLELPIAPTHPRTVGVCNSQNFKRFKGPGDKDIIMTRFGGDIYILPAHVGIDSGFYHLTNQKIGDSILMIGDHITPEAGITNSTNWQVLVNESEVRNLGNAVLRLYNTGENESSPFSTFDLSIVAKKLLELPTASTEPVGNNIPTAQYKVFAQPTEERGLYFTRYNNKIYFRAQNGDIDSGQIHLTTQTAGSRILEISTSIIGSTGLTNSTNWQILTTEANLISAGDAILRLYVTGETETVHDSFFDVDLRANELLELPIATTQPSGTNIPQSQYKEFEGPGTQYLNFTRYNSNVYVRAAGMNIDSGTINLAFQGVMLPTINILSDSGNVAENAGPAKFKLTAIGLTTTTTLMINATPAEDGHDFLTYTVADTSANFPIEFLEQDNGTYIGELSVSLDNDRDGEATGKIKLTLNANTAIYQLGSTTEGKITIYDDDAPELKIEGGDSVLGAAGAVAKYTVSAAVSPNKQITIYYTVSESSEGDGSFLASTETGPKNKTLNFSSGVKSVEFTIPLVGDDIPEDSAVISVALMLPDSNSEQTYTVSRTHHTGLVPALSSPVIPTLSIADAEGTETDTGTGTVVFDVTLMPAASEVVTVSYYVFSIPPDDTATGGDNTPTGDYVTTNGTLRFEPNDTMKQITVITNGDSDIEADETFTVAIVGASSNATIAKRTAIGTIESNETPVFTISNATIEEGDTGSKQLEFTVTLSSGATEAKSVKFRTVNGTALAGEDYTAPTAPNDVREFTVGEKSKTISIPILGDRNYERDETFTVQLYENSAGTQILTSDATGTIENNDPEAPLVTITGGPAVNEGGRARFNLSFPEYQANAINVRVQFSDDNGGFLDPNRNRIQTFSFFETKSITEQTLINYNTNAPGTITATILPDDAIPATYAYGSQRSAQVTLNNLVFTNLVSLDDAIENSGVTRGHNFIITAKINQTQSMYTSIPYTIENVGNRAPSLPSTSGFIIIQAGTLTGTKSISVNQFHPTNIAADAAYKVTIQTNPSSVYTLNTQASEITIPVRDNSQPTAARPVVSIAPTTPGDVVAGSPVSFTVTANPCTDFRFECERTRYHCGELYCTKPCQ